LGITLLTTAGLRAQDLPHAEALATATARALEPGVRAALRDGRPVSFEHPSSWGEDVKTQLEASLGLSLSAEHERGASRILLGAPRIEVDTAVVEVWFGRCEGTTDELAVLKVRMYSFTFRNQGQDWSHLRSSRLGTTEGRCDADWQPPGTVQT
jgi:hypothetical protein